MPHFRIDLHTHLKVARRMAFRVDDAVRCARALRAGGLDGLAITEHAHGYDFWEMYDALAARFPFRLGRYEVEDAFFYPGVEITLEEHVDVLVLAGVDELRDLDAAFPTPLTRGYHPCAEELVEALLRGVAPSSVRIAAHPERSDKHIETIPLATRKALFHAAEINACYADDDTIGRISRRVRRKEWAITAGSDAHTWPQLGAAWTEFSGQTGAFEELRAAIFEKRTEARVSGARGRRVELGARYKAHLKGRATKLPKLPWITRDMADTAECCA